MGSKWARKGVGDTQTQNKEENKKQSKKKKILKQRKNEETIVANSAVRRFLWKLSKCPPLFVYISNSQCGSHKLNGPGLLGSQELQDGQHVGRFFEPCFHHIFLSHASIFVYFHDYYGNGYLPQRSCCSIM